MSEEIESHLYKKFEILQKLGKGAYGVVWKAVEKHTKKVVALKKVFEAFHNSTDAQRTFREVMILQEIKDHENIIKLKGVIKANNNKDLYLVFEYMETDLHAVIKAGILKKVHKQYIIYQLLKGLKFIQSGDIIHRDLKPSNLLINSECLVKIADFGLARSVNQKEEKDTIMTEYVATRWYRAPEIVLGSNRYSKAVDMWSVGCILAELINGKALFPGKSTLNQIELILEVLGKPSYQDIKSIDSENALSIINSINIKNKRSFESFFKDQNPVTIDFLKKCLEFNPKKRISVEKALEHPFVAQFHDSGEEKEIGRAVLYPIDDNHKLSIDKYREALYNDIHQKKKEQKNLWRKKYLKQLGIDISNANLSKELFKNIVSKKKQFKRRTSTMGAKKKEKKKSVNKKSSKSKLLVKKTGDKKKYNYKYKSVKDEYKRRENNPKGYKTGMLRKYASREMKKNSIKKETTGYGQYYKKTTGGYGNYLYPNKYNNYDKISNYYKNILNGNK